MLTLTITGETIAELKEKAFEALGVTTPGPQYSFPLKPREEFPSAQDEEYVGHSMEGDVSAPDGTAGSPQMRALDELTTHKEKTKRTRAKKVAAVELDEEQINEDFGTPKATNKTAMEEMPEVEDSEIVMSEIKETKAKKAAKDTSYNISDCRTALSKVMEEKGTQAAIEILSQFDAKKLPELDVKHYTKFVETCGAAL